MFVGLAGVPRTSWDKPSCVLWVYAKTEVRYDFSRFYERRRMNTSIHKNRGNVATFGSNVTMFLRVIMPTSRNSRRWKCQYCDVPEHVEI